MKSQIIAQTVKIGGQTIRGPLGGGINTLGDVINRVMTVLVPFAAVVLFLVLVWGGYDFVLSGGNPEKVKKGKAKITTALVGFLLLVFSFLIVRLVSQIFGLGTDLFQ
ncbi:hypothetical protein HYT33_03645 [Candidatus Roizmanbacteria bacterium]|nr:hypothetical protein [Candidatus Roizmanbacteria bacterium]